MLVNDIVVKDDSSGSDPKLVISWEYTKDDNDAIDDLTITAPRTIFDTVELKNGQIVQVYISSDNTTYKRRFYGYIDQFTPEGATYEIICKNELMNLVRRNVNKIYDSSVDPSAGVISKIVEDLIETYGGLNATVEDSGTDVILEEFKCVFTDIYGRVKALRKALGWRIYYDDETRVVFFEPNGFISSGLTLSTENNIVGVPKWEFDTTNMINDLRVDGATVETTITESGQIGVTSGYTTADILLTKTPNSTEVLMDSSNPPTTQLEGGTKDASTGNDYYLDYENKKVVSTGTFTTNDYAIINYVWSAPAPIHMINQESIDNYGLYEKQIELSDITSVADAESRATELLVKHSVPLINGEILIKSNQNTLKVGQTVQVEDNITRESVSGEYVVDAIKYKYPSPVDTILVGDKAWRLADTNENVEERLKRLEEQFIKNQDLLLELVSIQNTPSTNIKKPVPRYRKIYEKNIAGESMIYGNTSFGVWGTAKWGSGAQTSFILGHSAAGILGTSTLGSDTSEDVLIRVLHYEDEYTEEFFDDDFKSSNTTATWGDS